MKSDEERHLEEWTNLKGYLEERLKSVNRLIEKAEKEAGK